MKNLRLIEPFNAIPSHNDWFRILPLGTFARFGRKVTITPQIVREMAAHFGQVPDTGIPVTRAHDDTAGKVGDVAEVKARQDGLWARIDWTAAGLRLLAERAFHYLSPEIVWGPTDYDGRTVRNVLTGLSLVNRPFFGRPVSLFWLRPQTVKRKYRKEYTYMEEPIKNTPQEPRPSPGLIDRLLTWLANQLITWLLPQTQDAQARLDELAAQQEEQRFGALENAGLGEGWAKRLARVAEYDATLANAIAAKFDALLTQHSQSALFTEIGNSGSQAMGPVEQFNAAVKAAMYSYGLDYAGAGKKIAAEQPDLYAAYQQAVTNRF